MKTPRSPRLAMDRSSRTYDADGHLRIADNLITSAGCSEYVGYEIPHYQRFGLQANRIYTLLRPEAELRRAAPSLRGKPLLSRHVETTADNHAVDAVCGAVGSDVQCDNGVVRASLVLWTADAIDGVESGDCRSLSAGYYYEFDPTPGVYQGVPYTGQMKSIQFNHVALTIQPRVLGAMVNDSAPETITMDMATYKPLMDFLDTQLDADGMEAVTTYLQSLCDPDGVNTATDRRRRLAGDSRLGRRVVPAFDRQAARASYETMFPNANRLLSGF